MRPYADRDLGSFDLLERRSRLGEGRRHHDRALDHVLKSQARREGQRLILQGLRDRDEEFVFLMSDLDDGPDDILGLRFDDHWRDWEEHLGLFRPIEDDWDDYDYWEH